MTFRSLIYSLLVAGVLGACGKKKDDPQPPTASGLLSATKWQIRSSIISAPGTFEVDAYPTSPPCKQDDFVQFKLPNTFVFDEGPTICSKAYAQTELGIWSLFNNDTQLVITSSDGLSQTYMITELTATSLKTTTTLPQSNGIDATVEATYVSIK